VLLYFSVVIGDHMMHTDEICRLRTLATKAKGVRGLHEASSSFHVNCFFVAGAEPQAQEKHVAMNC
jgi:hypothetical protein